MPEQLMQMPGAEPPMMPGNEMGGPMPMDANGVPPEMMPPQMPDQSMPPMGADMGGGLPPEIMDQIAAEQMAAGDAMPGDGIA